MFIVSVSLLLATAADAILMPKATGPYTVGTTVLEIVDVSRSDPLAPSPQPRDLMVSLFYPTNVDSANCTFGPQFPPATAAAGDIYLGLPSGSVQQIESPTCVNATLSEPNLPLLLFSPGLGGPRLLYSTSLAEVASYGYNVVSIDHPYDGLIVEYPDGRTVYRNPPIPENSTDAEILAWNLKLLEVRVADTTSVLDALSDPGILSKIPGFGKGCSPPALKTDKVGIYGHSFGGATSLQAIANDTRLQAGINLDGKNFGDVQQRGIDAPFMFFGTPSHNSDSDRTWAETWPNLRGFKREYVTDGAKHNSYTDLPIFRDLVGDVFPSEGQDVGPINGSRILSIEAAYIDAFFGRYMKGQDGALLDGQGAEQWPEVTRKQ